MKAGSFRRKLLVTLIILVIGAFGIPSQASADVVSDFESGDEGWTVIEDGYTTWQSSGGNPGGWLQITDQGLGPWVWAIAPSKFLGDWSAYDYVSTDIRMVSSTADRPFEFMISGMGGSAIYYSGTLPTSSWQTIQAPLQESSWSVTEGTWEDIISNVEEFRVKAEFCSYAAEACGIDNVILSGGPSPIPTFSEWGLIIFGVVLLGFITYVFLKRRKVIGVRL